MRKIIFWSHLAVGLAIALVVMLLSITGLLLTYEVQITRWAETPLVSPSDQPPLPAGELAAIASLETGGQVTALQFSKDENTPVAAVTGRQGQVFLDPYTGAALPEQGVGIAAFFQTVEHLHRWLALSGEDRALGRAVTGATNLAFVFLLLSGLYLWWPKIWKWRILRMNVWFRRNLPSSKARDYNWHHVFGFWALVPLLAIGLSGVVISYPWASDMVFRLYGEEPSNLRRSAASGQAGLAAQGEAAELDLALEKAGATLPDWQRMQVALPVGDTIRVTVDRGTGRQPAKQVTLTFDGTTGEPLGQSGSEDRTKGQQARIFLRFLHTGEVFGLFGQTLAGLATAFAILMTYTGAALSYRRLLQPVLQRRRRARPG